VADEEIKAKEPLYGGGVTSGGIEARVAKVEAHIEHILADLSALKAGYAGHSRTFNKDRN